jgi:hypothetical protein
MVNVVKVFPDDISYYLHANDVVILDSIPLSMGSMYDLKDIDGLEHLKGVKVPKCFSSDEIDRLRCSLGIPPI